MTVRLQQVLRLHRHGEVLFISGDVSVVARVMFICGEVKLRDQVALESKVMLTDDEVALMGVTLF